MEAAPLQTLPTLLTLFTLLCLYYSNCSTLLKQKHGCLYTLLENGLMRNEKNVGVLLCLEIVKTIRAPAALRS